MRRALVVVLGAAAVAACASFSADAAPDDPGVDASASEASTAAHPTDAAPTDDADDDAGDAATACGSAGPTSDLALYLPFDDPHHPLRDCSGNGHDGTYIQEATGGSLTTGQVVKALAVSADDKTGCVTLGEPPSLQLQTMTISVWIRPHSFPQSSDTGYIIGQAEDANTAGWRFATTADDLNYVVWSGGETYDFEWDDADVWHHIALTLDAGNLGYYFDGHGPTTKSAGPLTFDNVELRIGCKSNGDNYFDGAIDELRVYSRVLTPAEIQALAAQ